MEAPPAQQIDLLAEASLSNNRPILLAPLIQNCRSWDLYLGKLLLPEVYAYLGPGLELQAQKNLMDRTETRDHDHHESALEMHDQDLDAESPTEPIGHAHPKLGRARHFHDGYPAKQAGQTGKTHFEFDFEVEHLDFAAPHPCHVVEHPFSH